MMAQYREEALRLLLLEVLGCLAAGIALDAEEALLEPRRGGICIIVLIWVLLASMLGGLTSPVVLVTGAKHPECGLSQLQLKAPLAAAARRQCTPRSLSRL